MARRAAATVGAGRLSALAAGLSAGYRCSMAKTCAKLGMLLPLVMVLLGVLGALVRPRFIQQHEAEPTNARPSR